MLIGAVLLVAAIGIFLGLGQWKLYRQIKDLPRRLGIDIQQQADGINYTQSHKGKTLFKLHAARAIQMKASGKMLLHDVHIDLYGEDGSRTDTIAGSEFEYDHTAGIAQAAGAVEITIMRPGVKPAITQLVPGAPKPAPAPPASSPLKDNQVHVKTSGLTFNQNTGVATTAKRVDFTLEQGSGSSTGATYDSSKSQLVLDRDVDLHVERNGDPVSIRATHAEFLRTEQICQMTGAKAEYSGGTVATAAALMHFREDGSVERLDGSGGVDLQTDTGSHITAPRGSVDFDEQNHPRHGLLEGGTTMDLAEPNRHIHGTAPSVRMLFTGEGQLHHAHLEQGVVFNSQQQVTSAKGVTTQVKRSWKSQVADIDFVPDLSHAALTHAAMKKSTNPSGHSGSHPGTQNSTRVEAKTIHGMGGVIIVSDAGPGQDSSNLSADTLSAQLAAGGALSSLDGHGHAHFEQQTAKGVHETGSSDDLKVAFVDGPQPASKALPTSHAPSNSQDAQIQSLTQIGKVVFTREIPPSKATTNSPQASPAQASTLHATADRSDYDGNTQTIHLSGSPRVTDGELEMAATAIDFVRSTGDAFAHGNVKASWTSSGLRDGKNGPGASPGLGLLSSGLSTSTPTHAIADEAELRQSTEDITFRSSARSGSSAQNLPRLWQDANSVSAPTIVLNRLKQTLTAESGGPASPVRTVLLSNGSGPGSKIARKTANSSNSSATVGSASTSIIRIRSGDLHYSEGERLALLHAGRAGAVTTETSGPDGTSTVVSQEAEIKLLPAGIHPTPRDPNPTAVAATAGLKHPSTANSVDRVTATGHVTIDWPDRRGTGEKLVFLGDEGTYTLSGTGANPPRITDAIHGTVTGKALIFRAADESVTVEGDGSKTVTETQAVKKRPAAH